ncbi:hypothetical protein GPECTOR_1043g317 [Gonium pectorale]|uniref:Uncharacterized protein n=1 Tax=Gonium pectorale TaxID=33097 RepID=A0A150FTT8_GONPE|nr:hypothetical protein GPECTOR_1043g317 [Gonium pectorale]|eukprot:KXZ40988.1 hypothetical protein GPECTOR_1043g317 [Gonium pectorale]
MPVYFFSNALPPSGIPKSEALLRLLRESEPALLAELIAHLERVARPAASAGLSGLSLFLDSARHGAPRGNSVWPWASAVVQPCRLRAPSLADLTPQVSSRLALRHSSSPLHPLPSGVEQELLDWPALLVRFTPRRPAPGFSAAGYPAGTDDGTGLGVGRGQLPSPLAPRPYMSYVSSYGSPYEAAVLGGLASAVTALDVVTGAVLYQNRASVLCWGDCAPAPWAGGAGAGAALKACGTAAAATVAGAAAAATAAAGVAASQPPSAAATGTLQVISTDRTPPLSASQTPAISTAGLAPSPLCISVPARRSPSPSASPAAAAAAATAVAAAGGSSAGTDRSPRGGGAGSGAARVLRAPMAAGSGVDATVELGLRAVAGGFGSAFGAGSVGGFGGGGGGGGEGWLSGAQGGHGLLERLFALEPAKLQRMLHETCVEGRPWKGG